MFNFRNYEKALVVGAGSGRDMASCVLVTEKLPKGKMAVDLAGFLTPWALHTFGGALERPVNRLSGQESRKFIASRKEVFLDSYFEPELARLNTELGLGIRRFYLFSLQYGTEELKGEIERLITENAYDVIIALDVGGDILARKEAYPWLLTPMVDFSCLSILGGLAADVASYLTVAAPGVDGEIPSPNLMDIFDELESNGLVLDWEVLEKKSRSYQTYRTVANHINTRTGSHSNTFRLIEKVLSSKGVHVSGTLEKRVYMEDRKWRLSFPLDLRLPLARRMYCLDLKTIHATKDTGLAYDSVLDAFVKLKRLGAGGTEVDLSFVPRTIGGGRYRDPVFLLTPPKRVKGKKRKAILEHGVSLAAHGHIPYTVMLETDVRTLGLPRNLHVGEVDQGLCCLFRNSRERIPA